MFDGGQHFPAIDLQQREECAVVDAAGVLQTTTHGVDQRAMCHRFAKRRLFAVFEIRVNFIEVARKAAEVEKGWKDFVQLKKEGKVEKIGFSLYETYELELILNDGIPFDLIQIPFNIFDRQFEPYFERLKAMKVEIHVRSN